MTNNDNGTLVLADPARKTSRTIRKMRLVPGPYKGFLYIKCPKCGNTRGIYAKTETECYRCKTCGSTSDLPPYLAILYVNCECGKDFKYLTNVKDKMFDVSCMNCGSPVATHYNERTGVYESIRPIYRRKKK